MSGFVDVSHMSDLEIKRLGQMDEDYIDSRVNDYYRKPVRKVVHVNPTYNSDDVWAAAWQAYVQNGNQYLKVSLAVDGQEPKFSNRIIVTQLLETPELITTESREQAVVMRQYFKGLTFKLIEGKVLSEFMSSAYDIACKDAINSNFDLGVITSLPATYERAAGRDTAERRINFARGGHAGVVGEKVELDIEVIKQNWSQKWMTWYITGITNDDKVVFFAYKKELTVGEHIKITGSVKAHRENSTQLARVKVL